MSCPRETDAGAFALDILDTVDSADFARHLAHCRDCRAAYDDVADTASLLALVDPSAVGVTGPRPRDEVGYQRLRTAAARRPGAHRRRWVAAVAAAALFATAAGSAVVAVRTAGSPAGVTVSAARFPVSASVRVIPVSDGSRLTLTLRGVPPEEHCRLVAVGRDGQRQVASVWEATYDGTATVGGRTDIRSDHLAGLRVETDDGTVLVALPMPARRG